jgi:hypothetical protein
MTHDEIQDLLEGYVDETLDRATRREVDAHLATCQECRGVLEGVAPVDLGGIEPAKWTPRDMRRAVRRSMFRVAVDAVLLVIAVTLVAWLVSLTLIHPLVINRGGRAEAATIATADLAVMFNPGASVMEYQYHSRFLARTSEVTVAMPVGTLPREVATLGSTIGPLAFGDSSGGRLFPFFSGEGEPIGGQEQLEAVGDGTVATVLLSYETPLDMDEAGELTDGEADVRVVWAGFSVGEASGLSPSGVLGYGTCGSSPINVSGAIGASGGGGGSSFGQLASIDDALGETVRALSNLYNHPDLLEGIGASRQEAEQALADLGNPRVASLVVTGPTDEVIGFIEEAAPDFVNVLAIDFTNWFQPLCGR